MRHLPHSALFSSVTLAFLLALAQVGAQTPISNGDFESTPFATAWTNTGAIESDGFAPGSSTSARFTSSGQILKQPVTWGGDWHLDFWFMLRPSTDRQFSLIIETGGGTSTVNLRYEGGWFTYDGGWGSALSLGPVSPSVDANGDGDADDAGDTKNVYHMRVTGHGWGTATARYDLELSDANGEAFTSAASGLTRFQGGTPTSSPPNAFKFGTEYGSNPGFWLDDVTSHDSSPATPPPTVTYFVASPANITPGQSATLSWQVADADIVTLEPGGIDVTGMTSFPVSPTATQQYTLNATSAGGSHLPSFTVGVDEAETLPLINEFLAVNADGEDWIELHNPNAFSLDLAAWALSDSATNPDKWTMPRTAIAPGGYRVFDADEIGFSLAGDGEYLGLSDPDGDVVSEFTPMYPAQFEGVSYGVLPGGGVGFFGTPTPGQANASSPFLTDYIAEPQPDGSIRVSLLAGASGATLTAVRLHYRTMFGAEIPLAMADTGGGLYEATIPSGAVAAGEMLRWRITAEGDSGEVARLPRFTDPASSPEYFGTLIDDPSLASSLPILHWFQEPGTEAAADTRSGTNCSLFWNGELYDNVRVHLRGASTASLEKISRQFEFDTSNEFHLVAGAPRVDQINLNAAYSDSSYIRDILPMEHLQTMGLPAPDTFPVRLQRNGAFHSLAIMIEQPDKEFLRRHDHLLDEDSALFKATGNGSWLASTTGFEARNDSDLAELSAFTASLNGAGQLDYLLQNLDLPSVVNYLAVGVVDSIYNPQKNYYLHRNRFGEWMILPWDRDFSYGHRWLGSGDPRGPAGPINFLVADERIEWGGSDDDHKGGYNRLFDAIYANASTREMFYRRLRSVIDQLLAPGVIEARIEELRTQMKPEADLDRAAWGFTSNGSYSQFPQESFDAALNRIETDYLPARRDFLETDGGSPARGTLPASQPVAPAIDFGTIVVNPASGNQDEESIELQNPNAFAVDVSNWRIEGGVDHTLRPGTAIPASASLFLSPDVQTFRATSAPAFAQGNYSGHLSNLGETLTLTDADGAMIATTTTPANPSDNQRYLVISEIMYHPEPDGDDEYIELHNTSDAVTLDLGGVAFTAGIDYVFPTGLMLAPGARVVIARTDFLNGTKLSNSGERIKLDDADSSTIAEFTYRDDVPWPTEPDTLGHSLVYITGDPDFASSWRASTSPGGNPGISDSVHYTGGDLLDYALAASPEFDFETMTLSVTQQPAADDAELVPRWSTDLQTWHTSGFDYRGPGLARWQFTAPPVTPRMFFDLEVRLR